MFESFHMRGIKIYNQIVNKIRYTAFHSKFSGVL